MSNLLPRDTQTNDFNPKKIQTGITAKNKKTGSTEIRQIVDEREITVQMNVSIMKDANNNYTFKPNTFDEEGKIKDKYNTCPYNIMEFLAEYLDKYGKFPDGNVSISEYDSNGNLILTTQGAAEVSYNIDEGYVVDKTGEFMNAYETAMKEKTADFEVGEFKEPMRKDEEADDMLFYSSEAWIQLDEATDPIQAHMVFVPYIENPGEDDKFTVQNYYGVNFSDDYTSESPTANKYYFGYITEKEREAGGDIYYSDWLTENKNLGTFNLAATKQTIEEQEVWVIDSIHFKNYAVAPTRIISKAVITIICYADGGGIINGMTIFSRQTGESNVKTGENPPVIETKKLEFQFYQKFGGTGKDTIKMQIMKYSDIQEFKIDTSGIIRSPFYFSKLLLNGEYNSEQGTLTSFQDHYYKDVYMDYLPRDERPSVFPLFMYRDHDIDLPELINTDPEETEEE